MSIKSKLKSRLSFGSARKAAAAASPLDEDEEKEILIRGKEPSTTWSISGKIGEGSFAKVHKCINKTSNVAAAVKIFVNCVDEEDVKDVMNEIEILSSCQHKNIVKFYEAYSLVDKIWVRNG
jgi:serine/threonine protein kinase